MDLPSNFCSTVAIAAKYRPAFLRLERYLSAFAALSAGSGEQFAFRAKTRLNAFITAVADLPRFASLTAGRTTLGSIIIPFGLKFFLFFHAKGKSSSAIEAGNCLFLQTH
jgi:hypothetical protein